MKQGILFCFVLFCFSHQNLPNHDVSCCILGIFEKLSMNSGALMWFNIVWDYNVESIDY